MWSDDFVCAAFWPGPGRILWCSSFQAHRSKEPVHVLNGLPRRGARRQQSQGADIFASGKMRPQSLTGRIAAA
jgi:hypothetical protein